MDLMDKYLAWTDRLADHFPFGGMGFLIAIVGGVWIVSVVRAITSVVIWWYVHPVS